MRHTVAHRARSRHSAGMTDTTTTPASHLDLTEQEREAGLDLAAAQAARRPGRVRREPGPVPGHRLGRHRLRRRQRHPDRALLPVAPGAWSSSPTPARRTGSRDHKAFVLKSGSIRFVIKGAVSPDSPLVAPPRASTATASSTSRSRCPTSTGASRRPGAPAPRVVQEPEDRHRRARHRAHRRHRDLRRDPPHPRPARRRLRMPAPTCPATSPRRRPTSSATAPRSACSRPSTTSSATSSSARWTSGSASTTGSWAS